MKFDSKHFENPTSVEEERQDDSYIISHANSYKNEEKTGAFVVYEHSLSQFWPHLCILRHVFARPCLGIRREMALLLESDSEKNRHYAVFWDRLPKKHDAVHSYG